MRISGRFGTFAAAGAFCASPNTATGRAVTSWFPRERRGFALGVRQTAVPIGGFAVALGLPPVADHSGSRAAMLVLAGSSLVAAGLLAIVSTLARRRGCRSTVEAAQAGNPPAS